MRTKWETCNIKDWLDCLDMETSLELAKQSSIAKELLWNKASLYIDETMRFENDT